jgi:hypothetical protein
MVCSPALETGGSGRILEAGGARAHHGQRRPALWWCFGASGNEERAVAGTESDALDPGEVRALSSRRAGS